MRVRVGEALGLDAFEALFVELGLGPLQRRPPDVRSGGGLEGRVVRRVVNVLRLAGRDADPVLENGLVLAIEPMVAAGKYAARILSDGWTAVTVDKSRVAHFEHTVAVKDKSPEILTLCQKKNRSK